MYKKKKIHEHARINKLKQVMYRAHLGGILDEHILRIKAYYNLVSKVDALRLIISQHKRYFEGNTNKDTEK